MTDLLLELFSEEIPARMQGGAIEQLRTKLEAGLKEARLPYAAIRAYVTPRRMAVIVYGLPDQQPDQTMERKGPKISAPDAAIDGFCASVHLTRSQLQIRGEGKEAVYFAVSAQQGLPTIHALPAIITPILSGFHWPKSMRWADFDPAWVRPLRSIVCLFGAEIVPVTWGHITAGRTTQGHRFMASGDITIATPDEYEAALERAYVIADAGRRKESIRNQAAALAAKHGFSVRADEGLLEEVTGLVEHPTALMGSFDASYLRLPPEVLVLEMRYHQKYFAVMDASGNVTNRFITLANLQAKDGGASIVAGNERVIRARLEDGAFYYEQDRKRPLDIWAEGLTSMLFHKRLGTVADKVERIKALAEYLTVFVPHAHPAQVQRAATLCKADLTTGMVGEFPELQGVMGRYYALEQQEETAVADAIRDHYKPAGVSDDVSEHPTAIVVALADKLDTLIGLFAAGEIPTGSKDPYALRRAALGILRIIRTHGVRLSLDAVIHVALLPFAEHFYVEANETSALVQRFMMERLRVALREEGARYDMVEAALCAGAGDDVVRIEMRLHALQTFLATEDGASVLSAYKRASNILKKEEAKDGVTYSGDYGRDLIIREMERTGETYERDLVRAISEARDAVQQAVLSEDDAVAMQKLNTLRAPLDAFFTHVIVNSEDAAMRANRLHILSAVRGLVHEVADFSAIEG
jgi:glycyl-tRNA synthetase beta chain